MGGISIWQLLIILVIVVLLFGTKRLKGMGSDLGSAIKGFKKRLTKTNKTQISSRKSTWKKKTRPTLWPRKPRAMLKKSPNV